MNPSVPSMEEFFHFVAEKYPKVLKDFYKSRSNSFTVKKPEPILSDIISNKMTDHETSLKAESFNLSTLIINETADGLLGQEPQVTTSNVCATASLQSQTVKVNSKDNKAMKKTPPLFILDKADWAYLSLNMKDNEICYSSAKDTTDGIRVDLSDDDEHLRLTTYLVEKGINFRTYLLGEELMHEHPGELQMHQYRRDLAKRAYEKRPSKFNMQRYLALQNAVNEREMVKYKFELWYNSLKEPTPCSTVTSTTLGPVDLSFLIPIPMEMELSFLSAADNFELKTLHSKITGPFSIDDRIQALVDHLDLIKKVQFPPLISID